jgi:hypothetical protein
MQNEDVENTKSLTLESMDASARFDIPQLSGVVE